MTIEWIFCPVCGAKTGLQIRENTEIKTFLSIVLGVKLQHL